MGWLTGKNSPITSLSAKKDMANRNKTMRADATARATTKRKEAKKVQQEIEKKTKAGDRKGLTGLYERQSDLTFQAHMAEKSAKRIR